MLIEGPGDIAEVAFRQAGQRNGRGPSPEVDLDDGVFEWGIVVFAGFYGDIIYQVDDAVITEDDVEVLEVITIFGRGIGE